MSAKVVDASALAAILFGEPRSEEAALRLADAELFAPNLLAYELANVCAKKLRVHPSATEQWLSALATYDSFRVTEMKVPYRQAASLAQAHRLSAYDAAYLWLARELAVELVTLDDRLAKAARG